MAVLIYLSILQRYYTIVLNQVIESHTLLIYHEWWFSSLTAIHTYRYQYHDFHFAADIALKWRISYDKEEMMPRVHIAGKKIVSAMLPFSSISSWFSLTHCPLSIFVMWTLYLLGYDIPMVWAFLTAWIALSVFLHLKPN